MFHVIYYQAFTSFFKVIYRCILRVSDFFTKQLILGQYIFRELFVTYIFVFLFVNSVLFVNRIFTAVEWIVELHLPILTVLRSLGLYFLVTSEYTLLLSMILSSILAISRFSDDGEIIGMRSSGVSYYKIFTPVIFFGLFISLILCFLYEFVFPVIKEEFILTELRIYQTNPSADLSRNLFYETIDDNVISVEQVQNNKLHNVWIKFKKDQSIVFAPYGYLLKRDDEKNVYPLVLFNSIMHPMNTIKSSDGDKDFLDFFNAKQIIYLPDRPLNLYIPQNYLYFSLSDFYKALKGEESYIAMQNLKRLNDMQFFKMKYLGIKKEIEENKFSYYKKLSLKLKNEKILAYLRKVKLGLESGYMYQNIDFYNEKSYYFYRQVNLIFSAFAFCILGSSLGIFSKRGGQGKSISLGLGMIFIGLFLAMIFSGDILLKKHVMSPFLLASYFNIFYYCLALYFFISRVVDKNSIFKYHTRQLRRKLFRK